MNKITKHILWILAVIILLGIAGRCDYNEDVIYNMPDRVYQVMQKRLDAPSDSQLVDEYMKNKKYWDSLAFDCEFK